MPRRARLLVDGGYYHIVTRGNDKKQLFRHKEDYAALCAIIMKYLPRFDINIIHYCLMPNHIHLLIRALKGIDLPKFMQSILQVYGNHHKKKYKSVGYIYQNRYKSHLIESERYLLDCAGYMERNPKKAGIVNDLANYPWSSYPAYAHGKKDPIIRVMNPLYLELSENIQKRQQQYIEYVTKPRPYDDIIDRYFGMI